MADKESPSQPWGREYRRFRREQSKQIAKEIMRRGDSYFRDTDQKARWGFVLTFWPALIGWVVVGYPLVDNHIVIATLLFVVAICQLLLGMWIWFGSTWNIYVKVSISVILVGTFAWRDYRWLVDGFTPTYAYVVPTHELYDAERRAFFVQASGPRNLSRINLTVLDNKSGAVHVENYDEINPVSQNFVAPPYFWIYPSSPWDEDYTVTVTSNYGKTDQHLIVRSTRKSLQLGTEITTAKESKPVFACRDGLLPSSYSVAKAASQSCDPVLSVPPELQRRVQPQPYNIETADGNMTIVRLRTLPPPEALEGEREERHLWEYQKVQISSAISRYPHTKLLILVSGGQRTQEYAKEFASVFESAHWQVEGPNAVPHGDERIIDVQVSADNIEPPRSEVMALVDGLKQAGVKARKFGFIHDPYIGRDLIVLWVGPQAPQGIGADDCAPPSFKPPPGSHEPCEMIVQTPKYVPLVPP